MSNRALLGILLAAGITCALGATPTTRPSHNNSGQALPFTISKDTTAIIAPLDKNGRPNYLQALNNLAGEGLPPEKNAVVTWLRLVGTERGAWAGYGGQWKDVMRRLGTTDFPKKGEWEPIELYLNGGKENFSGTEEDRVVALGTRLWKQEEDPEVAGYLRKEVGFLKKLREIAATDGWYAPVVRFSNITPDDIFDSLRQGGEALSAEGTLAFERGDFDPFFQDVQAEMRLARKIARSPDLNQTIKAWRMNMQADAALGAALGSGRCTRAQLAQIRALLESMPPLHDLAEKVDRRQRWELLDALICFQEARADWKKVPIALGEWNPSLLLTLKTMNWDDVDGDVMLRQANALIDSEVAALRLPTFPKCAEALTAVNRKVISWRHETFEDNADFGRKPGETRAAYSARLGRVFLSIMAGLSPDVNETYWQGRMQDAMLNTLLAAATYRADTGDWPGDLQVLVPGYLREIPNDIYTKQPNTPVAWALSDQGAYVFSVGKNHRDDAGAADDILIGIK